MARKPKEKAEQKRPEILRTIRLPNGDLYGPGEEEEFVEALGEAAKTAKSEAKGREAKGLQSEEFDPKDELKRLTKLGMIVNFEGADVEDDDEDEDITHEQRATRSATRELAADRARERAVVAEVEEDSPTERVRNRNKARHESDARREAAVPPKRKKPKAGDEEGGGGTA